MIIYEACFEAWDSVLLYSVVEVIGVILVDYQNEGTRDYGQTICVDH